MTDDRMALRGLLEKASDSELLGEMIDFVAGRISRSPAVAGGGLPGRSTRGYARLWK